MTAETTHSNTEAVDDDRRNFIHIATGAVALGGAGMFAWAAIDQWNPAADTKAASSLDVDVSKVVLGGEIRVLIGGKPFFIRHRTEGEISAAESVNLAALPDPETDEARLRPKADGTFNKTILVTSGSCTHLGCVPLGAAEGENKGDFGGYFCPCHGSHYDVAGRIRKGPAPLNLMVPEYNFTTDSVIRVG